MTQPVPMSPLAFLIDLDGTLVDSEALKARAFADILQDLGIFVQPGAYAEVMGANWPTVIAHFFRHTGIEPQADEFIRRFRLRYLQLLEPEVRLTPGAGQLLEYATAAGIQLALVTSETAEIVASILARLGLARAFSCIITQDHVNHPKPNPEAYLLALRRLGREPGEVLVFEDTAAGLQAASAAGCRCIALRHAFNARQDLSRAQAVIESFTEYLQELKAPGPLALG